MVQRDHRCPDCGRLHKVAPKWCGCRPYPLEEPSTTYWLARVVKPDNADHLESEPPPAAPSPRRLRERQTVHVHVGMLEVAIDDEEQAADAPGNNVEPAPDDLPGWIDHYLQDAPHLGPDEPCTTGFVLGFDSHSPGVETEGETFSAVVSLSPDAYQHLCALANRRSSD